MKDPNDTRDIGPRVGSPLWIHMTSVTVAGLAVFAWAMTRLSGLRELVHHPLFWVIAALVVVGDMRPLVTPGRSGAESPVASLTFSFAALLYWGFPVAVLFKATSSLAVGLAQRKALHRSSFNAAQTTLAMAAAGLALAATGIHPAPHRPFAGADLPKVLLAGAAYFTVSFLLVQAAIALHSRAPLLRTLRAALPFQALVSLVLIAAAPLVAVVMNADSAWLVLLFAFPLAAIYMNAALSVQREHQAHHDELTGPGSCCWTWTASRRSTTRSGTRSATASCVTSRTGSPIASVPATSSPAWAATSSPCCSRRCARSARPGRLPRGCGRRCPSRSAWRACRSR
jgi:hypothetical protein